MTINIQKSSLNQTLPFVPRPFVPRGINRVTKNIYTKHKQNSFRTNPFYMLNFNALSLKHEGFNYLSYNVFTKLKRTNLNISLNSLPSKKDNVPLNYQSTNVKKSNTDSSTFIFTQKDAPSFLGVEKKTQSLSLIRKILIQKKKPGLISQSPFSKVSIAPKQNKKDTFTQSFDYYPDLYPEELKGANLTSDVVVRMNTSQSEVTKIKTNDSLKQNNLKPGVVSSPTLTEIQNTVGLTPNYVALNLAVQPQFLKSLDSQKQSKTFVKSEFKIGTNKVEQEYARAVTIGTNKSVSAEISKTSIFSKLQVHPFAEEIKVPRVFKSSYKKTTEINLITISLASANRIRQWAEKTLPNGKVVGEVINPETVHYKTLKPIKGGLFCERIFGPLKDFECACGTKVSPMALGYLTKNKIKNPKTIIEKTVEKKEETHSKSNDNSFSKKRYFCRICDVEYTYSIVRRTQLGYIQLASPTTHVWFVKGLPSYISILLDMKRKDLQSIIYNTETLNLEHALRGPRFLPSSPKAIFLAWQNIMKTQYPEKYLSDNVKLDPDRMKPNPPSILHGKNKTLTKKNKDDTVNRLDKPEANKLVEQTKNAYFYPKKFSTNNETFNERQESSIDFLNSPFFTAKNEGASLGLHENFNTLWFNSKNWQKLKQKVYKYNKTIYCTTKKNKKLFQKYNISNPSLFFNSSYITQETEGQLQKKTHTTLKIDILAEKLGMKNKMNTLTQLSIHQNWWKIIFYKPAFLLLAKMTQQLAFKKEKNRNNTNESLLQSFIVKGALHPSGYRTPASLELKNNITKKSTVYISIQNNLEILLHFFFRINKVKKLLSISPSGFKLLNQILLPNIFNKKLLIKSSKQTIVLYLLMLWIQASAQTPSPPPSSLGVKIGLQYLGVNKRLKGQRMKGEVKKENIEVKTNSFMQNHRYLNRHPKQSYTGYFVSNVLKHVSLKLIPPLSWNYWLVTKLNKKSKVIGQSKSFNKDFNDQYVLNKTYFKKSYMKFFNNTFLISSLAILQGKKSFKIPGTPLVPPFVSQGKNEQNLISNSLLNNKFNRKPNRQKYTSTSIKSIIMLMLNLKKTAFKNNYSHPISTLNNNGTSNQKNNFIDSLKYNLSNLKQTVLILKNTDAFSLMLRVTENTKKLSKQKAVWGELEIFSVLRFHKLYIQYLVNKICLIYRYALYNNKTLTFSFYSIFLSKFSKNKIHFFYFLKASQKQLVYYLYTSLIKDFLKIHTKTVFYDIITFTLQSYKQQFSLISSVQSVVSNNTPSSPGVKIGLQYIKLQRPFFLAYQKSKPALTAKSFYSSRIYNYMLISHTFWKLYQKDKFAKVPLNEYLTWRANNQFKIVGLSTPFLEQNKKQDLVFSTPFISGKKLSNNIYCISHRELWEQEKDWQDFAYFYYSPTVLTDLIIPSYENRSYESLFNFDRTLISLNNDVSENGININTSFSGAGLIQKLLNDMGSLSELKKIDKQNRILLFEYNKHLKKLKQKKKNPKVGKISYHKACNIRDLLIRRTKLTRKIQRSVNEMNINSNSFLMSDSQVTLNESKSSSSNIFNVGTANVSLKNSGLSGVTIGSLNQQALPLPLPLPLPLRTSGYSTSGYSTSGYSTSGYSTSGYTINKNNTVQNTVLSSTNSFAGNMILTILPVLPPVLRPVLKMSGQFTISDLNRLYQRIIYRNERLKKFLKDPALSSSFEMKYAQRLLQEAVDNLIQNGKSGVVPEKDARGRLLKSLSDILKGKQGRFRQYLLGKRVDYSARSVIVVGPRLKLHECGIPKEMAVVLYSPFLIKRILNEKLADTYLSAKKLLKTKPLLVSQLLREIMKVCPVLLNRAPTLHRLGFQAFQPKLVDGKAILLHPLVCPAFNADFDGDQMAVHIPITFEARAEAWKLMLARNNIKSPATGEPLMLPSQDMVLGCYYLTTNCAEKNMKYKTGSGMSFTNLTDVLKLYNQNLIHVHAVIWVNLTNSSLVHKPLNLNSTVTQGTKGPSGVKVLQGNNKTKREYFIEKSILPELQIANITAAEQPFEIRIPLLKCSVTGGTKADPSILQGKARKNQLQIKNITNFDTGFIPIGNYLEILKHIHHIIKISKTNQIIYKIIKTTPGKILFNIIIKNAIEKKPKLLWKHVYQTGSLRKQITTTIDSHIHNTVT